MEVEVCDGKANPANMASCIQQAIDAEAGAIVTGASHELVVAFESAQGGHARGQHDDAPAAPATRPRSPT